MIAVSLVKLIDRMLIIVLHLASYFCLTQQCQSTT